MVGGGAWLCSFVICVWVKGYHIEGFSHSASDSVAVEVFDFGTVEVGDEMGKEGEGGGLEFYYYHCIVDSEIVLHTFFIAKKVCKKSSKIWNSIMSNDMISNSKPYG